MRTENPSSLRTTLTMQFVPGHGVQSMDLVTDWTAQAEGENGDRKEGRRKGNGDRFHSEDHSDGSSNQALDSSSFLVVT